MGASPCLLFCPCPSHCPCYCLHLCPCSHQVLCPVPCTVLCLVNCPVACTPGWFPMSYPRPPFWVWGKRCLTFHWCWMWNYSIQYTGTETKLVLPLFFARKTTKPWRHNEHCGKARKVSKDLGIWMGKEKWGEREWKKVALCFHFFLSHFPELFLGHGAQ